MEQQPEAKQESERGLSAPIRISSGRVGSVDTIVDVGVSPVVIQPSSSSGDDKLRTNSRTHPLIAGLTLAKQFWLDAPTRLRFEVTLG